MSRNKTTDKPRIWVTVLVCFSLLATCVGLGVVAWHRFVDDPWSAQEIAATRERGDEIIEALRRYSATSGSFPAALNDLAPEYLPLIEAPLAGRRAWGYTAWTEDGEPRFILAVYSRHEDGSLLAMFSPRSLQITSESVHWELSDPGTGR